MGLGDLSDQFNVETAVVVASGAAVLGRRIRDFTHFLQLNSYRLPRYNRWMGRNWNLVFEWPALLPALCLVFPFAGVHGVGVWLWLLACLVGCGIYWRRKTKRAFALTKRAARLVVVASSLSGLLFAAILAGAEFEYGLLRMGFPLALAIIFVPFLIYPTVMLLMPVEAWINGRYLNDGANILAARKDLTKIGVSGSYGKTTCKMMLATLLAEKFSTLATPGSVNTPLGVTRVVREQLQPLHEMFVAEFGAKVRGDVSVLCELVKPHHGLISALGPEHLETFGTTENAVATELELVDGVCPNGFVAINADNDYARAAIPGLKRDVVLYGLESGMALDYCAYEICLTGKGTSFLLEFPDGSREPFKSNLLGRHNVTNLLGAIAIADGLGVGRNQIMRGVSRVKPVPHRLQLRPKSSGVVVIDDAYNSNPDGAAEALRILDLMPGGKKILVTPGMIELGAIQDEANAQFGRMAAGVCDEIVLVGHRQTAPIAEAVAATGFGASSLHIVKNFYDAQALLPELVSAGDVVLYENDLTDDYER